METFRAENYIDLNQADEIRLANSSSITLTQWGRHFADIFFEWEFFPYFESDFTEFCVYGPIDRYSSVYEIIFAYVQENFMLIS